MATADEEPTTRRGLTGPTGPGQLTADESEPDRPDLRHADSRREGDPPGPDQEQDRLRDHTRDDTHPVSIQRSFAPRGEAARPDDTVPITRTDQRDRNAPPDSQGFAPPDSHRPTPAEGLPALHEPILREEPGPDPSTAADVRAAAGRDTGGWRVASLLIRPFAIFFGITVTAYLFVTHGPATGVGSAGGQPVAIGRYDTWLRHLFPLHAPEGGSVRATVELAVAGLAAGLVLALVLGLAMRSPGLERLANRLSLAVLALSGPVAAVTVLYWLVVRFDVGLSTGAISVFDDWGGGVNRLILPAAVIGLAIGPPLATVLARPWPTIEPARRPALASPLASRSSGGQRWRLGFPAGLAVAALTATELVFNRPGLFALVVRSMRDDQGRTALDALAVIALAGAAGALAVDLAAFVADRRRRSTARTPADQAAFRPKRSSERQVRLTMAGLGILVVLGVLGGLLGRRPAPSVNQLVGPLSAGHVLGTDQVGRDLLVLAGNGLGQALVVAALPTLAALLVAYALAQWQGRFPRVGRLLPGAVIDAAWWPLPLMLAVAFPAVARGDQGLLTPGLLAVLAVGLVPSAVRLVQREAVGTQRGSLLRLLGVWLLLAPVAVTATLVAGLAGFDRTSPPSLGVQLGQAVANLNVSPWPAVVPGVTVSLLVLSLYGLGSALVGMGWHRSLALDPAALPPDHELHTEHDLASDAPPQPWWEDEEPAVAERRPILSQPTPGLGDSVWSRPSGPLPAPATSPIDRHDVDRRHVDSDDGDRHDVDPHDGDRHDGAMKPDGLDGVDPADSVDGVEPAPEGGLAPNYDLQPGLPPADLHATMRLPIVRVRPQSSE